MQNLRCLFWVLLFASAPAFAWGPEGHAIVAEIAQRRLTPEAAAAVASLLGRGHSLASVASWADDERDERPGSYNWHFVDIPLAADTYDAVRDCAPNPRGDCAVAELERLKTELHCANTEDARRDALRFAVHFVGDIHQPLHALADARGGNGVPVTVAWRGLTCVGKCAAKRGDTNLHAVWDGSLITSTTWSWGAYVDRLEAGWLKSDEARNADGGSPADWANQSHAQARLAWNRVPANRMLDDAYYSFAVPIVDRQLGLAGLRLARFLNTAYAAACSAR
ncbi:MAG TPA: S1/P1 nuclease [Burkholderiales bacterium]|jgi:hypothetical protein